MYKTPQIAFQITFCVLRLLIGRRSELHMKYGMSTTHGHEYKFKTIEADPTFIFLPFMNRLSHGYTHKLTQPKNCISDRISVKAMPLRDMECMMKSTPHLRFFPFAECSHRAASSECTVMTAVSGCNVHLPIDSLEVIKFSAACVIHEQICFPREQIPSRRIHLPKL